MREVDIRFSLFSVGDHHEEVSILMLKKPLDLLCPTKSININIKRIKRTINKFPQFFIHKSIKKNYFNIYYPKEDF